MGSARWNNFDKRFSGDPVERLLPQLRFTSTRRRSGAALLSRRATLIRGNWGRMKNLLVRAGLRLGSIVAASLVIVCLSEAPIAVERASPPQSKVPTTRAAAPQIAASAPAREESGADAPQRPKAGSPAVDLTFVGRIASLVLRF